MTAATRRHLLVLNLIGLAIAAPIAWDYFWPGDALHDTTGHQYGRDFINVWGGAILAFRGEVMTLFDYEAFYRALEALYGAEIPFHNWSYPPHILPLIWPLSGLSYVTGLTVWTLTGFAVYAAVVLARLDAEARGWSLMLLALAPSTLVNAVTGQNGFYTAALLLGAIALLERRPWLAGVLLGLLTVKPHLGVLAAFVLVACGAWRSILAATLTAAALVLITLMLWGADPWIGFLTRTTVMTRFYFDQFQGFYTYMMPSVFASARLLGLSMGGAGVVQGFVSVGIIMMTLIVIRRTQDVALRALLIAAGTLLVSPYAFNYDMTLLTGAVLWYAARSRQNSPFERWSLGLVWLIPVLIWPLHLWRVGIAPIMIGAVFMLAAIRILKPAPARSSGADPLPLPQASASG